MTDAASVRTRRESEALALRGVAGLPLLLMDFFLNRYYSIFPVEINSYPSTILKARFCSPWIEARTL